MGKRQNYLASLSDGKFTLSRGTPFEAKIEGLALVRTSSVITEPLVFDGDFSIIDINSGKFIVRAESKKKLLEYWEMKQKCYEPPIEERIAEIRKTDTYKESVILLNNEKKFWRDSGYLIEGR